MRVRRLLLTVALCAGPFTSALSPAIAQMPSAQAEAPLPCSGKINIVRVSNINPGMMDKFLKAVADQIAWYKSAGLPDDIAVMRVMEQDPATKTWKLSDTKAVTTHLMPAMHDATKHDAAWDAFVAEFGSSSKIEKSYMTCVAMPMASM